MTMPDRIVIIGAGQAAAQAVETLRKKGYAGRLTLIGDEDIVPYQRPPLSKKYLAGTFERDRLLIRHLPFYREHAIELRLGRRAVRIDRTRRAVELDDDTSVPYDVLLLATGSCARTFPVPGSQLPGIYTLRTLVDVDALRHEAQPGRSAVVIGGGYIGLEVAATLRDIGVDVTVIEVADRVMSRVVSEPVSRFYEAEHAKHGVRVVLNSGLAEFIGHERVTAVACADGSRHAADFVIVGVGVLPVDELARDAALECDNGIVVDERCRTADPHVFAAGDCTNHPSVHYGGRVRLESVDNAFEQATAAAHGMLDLPGAHDKVPWFWSDQYDLKMVVVGLSQRHDTRVLRGDPAARAFSVCYLAQGELIAIETVNSAKDQMAARKLIAARARPDPALLADPQVPLKSLAP